MKSFCLRLAFANCSLTHIFTIQRLNHIWSQIWSTYVIIYCDSLVQSIFTKSQYAFTSCSCVYGYSSVLSSVETSWWSSVCTRGCFCHLKWPHSPCLLHDHADQSLDIMPVHSCCYRSTIMSHRWQPTLGWRHSLAFSNVRRKGSDRQTNIFFLDFFLTFCKPSFFSVFQICEAQCIISLKLCCPSRIKNVVICRCSFTL